jgi:hypothetical protein
VIVHVARVKGRRRVGEIVELREYDANSDHFVLNPLSGIE